MVYMRVVHTRGKQSQEVLALVMVNQDARKVINAGYLYQHTSR